MTVIEAINRVNNVKPNTYTQTDKIAWLNELDGRIKREIIDTHEDAELVDFTEYTEDTLDVEMIAEFPYDDLYVKWLEAQIDYANGEFGKYNNSVAMFNSKMNDYANHYNSQHLPIGRKLKFW